MNTEVSLEIKKILDNNTQDDLTRFLNKRKCLNTTNYYLIYLFHLIQSSGIFVTSFAASNNNQYLIWVGIALNFIASIINVYEKTNNNILKKLMNDIKAIKEGSYIDEGEMIETPDKKDSTTDSERNNTDHSSTSENKQIHKSINV